MTSKDIIGGVSIFVPTISLFCCAGPVPALLSCSYRLGTSVRHSQIEAATTDRMMEKNQSKVCATAIALWMLPFSILLVSMEEASAYDFACNLYCYNGGECQHGHGKFGSFSGVEEEEELPWEKVRHENGMYCVCPVGYTGLQCEIKFVVCGQDDHTCFNGSRCKKDHSGLGESYWRCECDADHSVMTASYAGKFCEHESTVFCHGEQNKGTSFCTNGGKVRELKMVWW
jgi:hypothetical protein